MDNCWYSGASRQRAPWRNWAGAAWAPSFSAYGAMVFWGGGHGGGDDVSLYVFDFTTGLWSRVGPANPSFDYTNQLSPDFYDYASNGNYIVPALHTYNYPAYVPPNLPGSGPKGSWLLPHLVGGAGSGAVPHAVDLQSGVWSRFSTERGSSGQSPYAGSIEDTRRNKVWWAAMDAGTLNMLDLDAAHPRTIQQVQVLPAGQLFSFGGYYARHVYVPEADMAVGMWCLYGQNRIRGEFLDMTSGRPVRLGGDNWPDIASANGAGFGVDWSPDHQAFYIYSGFGSTAVTKLKPSTLEFHQATWTVTQESFNGAAWESPASNPNRQGAQVMSKWRYIPWLRCFAWCDGPGVSGPSPDGVTRAGVMQLWRPRDI